MLGALIAALLICGASGLAHHHQDATLITDQAELDRVDSLPGADPLTFGLYAGSVTVDEAAGRSLFYVLTESSASPEQDPLVLFLNGGPGCSSLGGGWMSELGPFYPTPGGEKLIPNKYAWNRIAHTLFLESPAGVGFSYSNRSSDLDTGDAATARDSYTFLLRWLERFPRFAGRPFWLAGESYAGHYVPNLAMQIVNGNKEGKATINLQGFLVGNPWTHAATENRAAVQFWWTHGMISTSARDGILKYCDFAAIGPLAAKGQEEQEEEDVYLSAAAEEDASRRDPFTRRQLASEQAELSKKSDLETCLDYVDMALTEFLPGVNIYDIYADVCLPTVKAHTQHMARMLRGHPAGISTRPSLLESKYDPCIDNEVEIYLNRPDVQAALHANTSGQLPGPWTTCTDAIRYSRRDLLSSMLPVYEELLWKAPAMRMLVYTGDIDAIVPVIGTRRWVMALGLEVEEPWRAWVSATGQVGGWTVGYARGLRFATVRGAGHMTPYTQPERSFHMFATWMRGDNL